MRISLPCYNLLSIAWFSATLTTAWQMEDLGLTNLAKDWISLSPGSEFQPADASDDHALGQAQRELIFGYSQNYVDAFETNYLDYSQAWRYLGFYIDCSSEHDKRRHLNEGENEGACTRYLLWAAYVDLDYEGNGLSEYKFYDKESGAWDDSACENLEGSRCAKMDCHLPDTHFKLLGIYKEEDYTEWMEQLFKHEGYCVWSNDEYNIMQNMYDYWPNQCTQSKTMVNGNYLYFHLKPQPGGDMSIGLYTDASCRYDYKGRAASVNEVIYSYYGNNNNNDDDGGYYYDFESNLKSWNQAFDTWKVCHPCKAYRLDNNSNENQEEHHRKLGDYEWDEDNDPNMGLYQCNDDAGYTNVNQCTKFQAKTDMESASYREIELANRQQSLVQVKLGKKSYGRAIHTNNGGWKFFLWSLAFFACSGLILWVTHMVLGKRKPKNLSESLIPKKSRSERRKRRSRKK